jgi:hypothetical protein
MESGAVRLEMIAALFEHVIYERIDIFPVGIDK